MCCVCVLGARSVVCVLSTSASSVLCLYIITS